MTEENHMEMTIDSRSANERFARVAVGAFMTQLNPTVEEVEDVKTAVSEAVTNCIIHGYEGAVEDIVIRCCIREKELELWISDRGRGIPDIAKAMEPMFSTKPEQERSGMGFAFMEAFMDTLEVTSAVGKGTTVHMTKKIGQGNAWED